MVTHSLCPKDFPDLSLRLPKRDRHLIRLRYPPTFRRVTEWSATAPRRVAKLHKRWQPAGLAAPMLRRMATAEYTGPHADRLRWRENAPFWGVHVVAVVGAIAVGWSWQAAAWLAGSYFV